MKLKRVKLRILSLLIACLFFGNSSLTFAFVAGKYRCARGNPCNLSGKEIQCEGDSRNENGEIIVRNPIAIGDTYADTICRYEPPFLIHVDGTYSKSSEVGTYKISGISGHKIDFSESRIRGTGRIVDENGLNQIYFIYINPFNGRPQEQTYELVRGTEEGTVTGTGANTGSKTLKAEVKVDYSVVRADGTVRADGGFDPEKGDVATFTFTPNDSEKVTMKVFSRHSEALDSGELNVTAGVATGFTWDGRTKDSKNPVASGVYIVRIEGSGVQETRKIVVVK